MSTVASGFRPWQAMRSSSQHHAGIETASAALIDQRGIGEAVAEHDRGPRPERAGSPLPRSARGWRSTAAVPRAAEFRHSRGRAGSCESAGRCGVPPGSTVSTTSLPCSRSHAASSAELRGLAAAVNTFERDEPAAFASGTSIFANVTIPPADAGKIRTSCPAILPFLKTCPSSVCSIRMSLPYLPLRLN